MSWTEAGAGLRGAWFGQMLQLALVPTATGAYADGARALRDGRRAPGSMSVIDVRHLRSTVARRAE